MLRAGRCFYLKIILSAKQSRCTDQTGSSNGTKVLVIQRVLCF